MEKGEPLKILFTYLHDYSWKARGKIMQHTATIFAIVTTLQVERIFKVSMRVYLLHLATPCNFEILASNKVICMSQC